MKILFITLSNIGDVILTLPVMDSLKEHFPHADIMVMSGPRTKEIFENNPYINRSIVFDKHAKMREKMFLFFRLARQNFDIVIDLRNSFYGAFLPAKYRISHFVPRNIRHMKARHLYKLKAMLAKMKAIKAKETQETTLFIKPQDKEYVKKTLSENNITLGDRIVVVSPGAKSHIKRWPKERFAQLVAELIEKLGLKVILVGDADDANITKYIRENCCQPVLDLAGKTSIAQLAYVLMHASALITNDSASLHLASYLNIPVLAIFGPTNDGAYGPWSDNSRVVKKDIFCRPCAKAVCRFEILNCMHLVRVEDVFRQTKDILIANDEGRVPAFKNPSASSQKDFKRILIVRTDRIGDVLLSTPVIRALRERYPQAYIAMMVSPYAKDIIDGNPYLDEVIIYDKDGKHKSWARSIKFALRLKKKKFDLALILHPINRVHLITFFAGIPRRVGYDRKLGVLLSDRIKHTKQYGEKHESEFNLDLLRFLGIEPKDKSLFMPIKKESEAWVEELFKQERVNPGDKLLAIHPAASCPSKIWPQERFAQVADKLAKKFGFKILVIAGPKDIAKSEVVLKNLRSPAINLAGRTSVSQLASVLKRCQLFISNDSGPVHIASAVGTPVISIFGRNQAGLSPQRWGPLGKKDRILHKEVGCIECLAHNCKKEFACLKAITVDDVLGAAESILKDK